MNVEVYSIEIIMACDNGQVHTFIVTGTAVLHVYVHLYVYAGCGNIEQPAGHFSLFSSLLSCSPYTLYTV